MTIKKLFLLSLLIIFSLFSSFCSSGDKAPTSLTDLNPDTTLPDTTNPPPANPPPPAPPPLAEPVQLVIKFLADGTLAGVDPQTNVISYAITATGTLPTIANDGTVLDIDNGNVIATIDNTFIEFEPFDFSAPPAVANFTCNQCELKFSNGSVLQSDFTIPLTGRALFSYGPVAFDPATPNIQTIRMMGCAGLQEVSDTGPYAEMVGSICFNGVFNFDVSDPPNSLATITGSSNCTIVLHTPILENI